MSKIKSFVAAICALFCVVSLSARSMTLDLFNDNWQFQIGAAEGAEVPQYDDSQWRRVNLPHDWAIEGPFSEEYNARCGGLPYHGTAWYRKSFDIKPSEAGRVINIIFDAAMSNSTVWVNGHELGHRPFGYVSFKYDISKYLNYGGRNVVAVRLQPEDYSSRYYPGAGLYRNVWLCSDFPVHIPHWGTYVTTPTITDAKAVVQVETDVENRADSAQQMTLNYSVVAPNGKVVAKKSEVVDIAANSKAKGGVWMDVKSPEIWDIDTPNLYKLITKAFVGSTLVDEAETTFGIRSITYDPDGFYLNGRKMRFQGVCLHHDNGPLGGALYERADERKLQIMKDMGANAIRTAHNPTSSEFLDLCDKLGLVVLVEAFDMWRYPKTPQDYSQYFDDWAAADMRDIVVRDRNHPSVIMWSTGNEIQDQRYPEEGWKTAKMLTDVCHT